MLQYDRCNYDCTYFLLTYSVVVDAMTEKNKVYKVTH